MPVSVWFVLNALFFIHGIANNDMNGSAAVGRKWTGNQSESVHQH